MANSKKPRHKAICSECNGNGYKQFQIQKDGKLNITRDWVPVHIVLQCDTCDSEGEIYVDESEVVELYVDDDTPTGDVGKLH